MFRVFLALFILLASPVYAELRSAIVETASGYTGVPYKWGGVDKSGVDCSGFVYAVFITHNISIPRMAGAQYKYGKDISFDELRPGDLVFYDIEGKADHVGLYMGDGRFLHASTSGKEVREARMDNPYYSARFLGARNIIDK